MRRFVLAAAAFAVASVCYAQPVTIIDAPAKIRFTEPVKAVPVPAPTPKPDPDAPIVLAGDSVLVVDSDTELMAWSFPAGLLSITKDAGPVKVRAKFADGNGKTETRTFKGKCVLTVEAVGAGEASLLLVPAGASSETAAVIRRIAANQAPQPPPGPVDPPKPPQPAPPIPGDGLRVLIVYETADLPKLPTAQQAILYGADVRGYLQSHCVAGPDGKTAEARVFDQNTPTAAESKLWQDAMARQRKSLPWLIVSNGKAGYEGPLPANVADTLKLLRQYGGD